MNHGFWEKLEKPFFVLAPMANVTDTVFRQIIVKHGRPDVLWTEFVACDGLCSDGREAVLRDLQAASRPRHGLVTARRRRHLHGLAARSASSGLAASMTPLVHR